MLSGLRAARRAPSTLSKSSRWSLGYIHPSSPRSGCGAVSAANADFGKRQRRIGCRRLALKTLSPGLTELSMGFERVASNHQGVDFAGPIEDLEGLAVSKQSLHAAAVVDTHGTEDLDRFDGVPHGGVGAE
jgi:hypothetical protein